MEVVVLMKTMNKLEASGSNAGQESQYTLSG